MPLIESWSEKFQNKEKQIRERNKTELSQSLVTNDGINYGRITVAGLNAIRNNTLNTYTPINEEEKITLENFRLNYKVPITSSDGKNTYDVSPFDLKAIDDYRAERKSYSKSINDNRNNWVGEKTEQQKREEQDKFKQSPSLKQRMSREGYESYQNYKAYEEELFKDEQRKQVDPSGYWKERGIDVLTITEKEWEEYAKSQGWHYVTYSGGDGESFEDLEPPEIKNSRTGYVEFSPETKEVYKLQSIAQNNDRRKAAGEDSGFFSALGGGFGSGITWGLGDWLENEKAEKRYSATGANMDTYVSPAQAAAKTIEAHPFAYGGGQIAGTVVTSMGVGGLVSGGLKAVGWGVGKATIARAATVQGLTGVLRGGITTASSGGDWGDIGTNALREGLTGALGGAAGGFAEKGLTKLLNNSKYATSTLGKLKNLKATAYGVNAVGGIADALADYKTDQIFVGIANNVFDAKLQERTGKDLLTDFAVSLALGTAMNMGQNTKAGVQTRVEDVVNRYGAEYMKYSNAIKDADVEATIKAGEEFIETTNKFKKELNEQLFPGKAKEVETLHEMLDVAIDSTKMDIDRAKKAEAKTESAKPVSTETSLAPKPTTSTPTVTKIVSTEGGVVKEDINGAIERIQNGTATNKDFEMFKSTKLANRKMLEDALGVKLPTTNAETNKMLKELPARLNPTSENIISRVGDSEKANIETSIEKIKNTFEGTGKDAEQLIVRVSNIADETVTNIKQVFGIDVEYGKILDTNLKALANNPDSIISESFDDNSFVKGYADAIGSKLNGITPGALKNSYFGNAPINAKIAEGFRNIVDNTAQRLKAEYDNAPSKVEAETPSVKAEETAPIPKVEEPTTPTVKAEEVIPVAEDISNVETTQSGVEFANSFVNENGLEFTRVDDIDDSFGVKILAGKNADGDDTIKIVVDNPDIDAIINSPEYRSIIENAWDIKEVRGNALTAERAFEKAFGRNYENFRKAVYDNLDKDKLQYMAILDYLSKDFKENVIKRGITKGSDDSALLQLYGEKKITLDELKAQTSNWMNIVEADKYMRRMYNALIDSINETKTKIYPYIEEQELKLKTDLDDVERKLLLLENGNIDGLTKTKSNKILRAQEMENVIKKIDGNSKLTMDALDLRIKEVKTEMSKKKVKDTKVYAELEQRLAKLEAKKERLKNYFELSHNKKVEQLNNLLGEYEDSKDLTAGLSKKAKEDLIAKRDRIEKELYDETRWRGKRIPKRDDYYHHFQEFSKSVLGDLLDKKNSNISAELVLKSGHTKPKSKWESFAQRRHGDETVIDAVGGYLDYIDAAAYAMTIDPNISVIRKLTDDIARETSSSNSATHGTNNANRTIQRLDALANELSGKTVSDWDRVVQDHIGRGNFRKAKTIVNKMKGAPIMYNVGSSVVQIANLPNAVAILKNKGTLVTALSDSWKELKPGKNNLYDAIMNRTEIQNKSSFLRERYYKNVKERFDEGILSNINKFGGWMLSVGDELSTRLTWNAFYREAQKLGVENPIQYADSKTRKCVGGRGLGEKSLNQQSAVLTAAVPFSLEVSNAWQVQKDLFKEIGKSIKQGNGKGIMTGVRDLLALYVANALINAALEEIRGSDAGSFNPVGIVYNNFFGDDKDSEENPFSKSAREIAGNFASSLPLGQTVAGYLDEETRKNLFGDEDPLRYGESSLLKDSIERTADFVRNPNVNTAVNAVSSFIPGGGQLRKTAGAIDVFSKGGVYDKNGNLKYPVEGTAGNYIKGALFGKSALNETQDFYDSNRKALTENETKEYRYRVGQGENPQAVYNDIYSVKEERARQKAESDAYYNKVDSLVKPISDDLSHNVDEVYNSYSTEYASAHGGDKPTGIKVPKASKEFKRNKKTYILTEEQCAELQNMYNTAYVDKVTPILNNNNLSNKQKYNRISDARKGIRESVERKFYTKYSGKLTKK